MSQDLPTIKALLERAEEIIVETADCEHQTKLLAFALLLAHMKQHKRVAKQQGLKENIPLSTLGLLDRKELIPVLTEFARMRMLDDAKNAPDIYELAVKGGLI
jgi:hypothetical protein